MEVEQSGYPVLRKLLSFVSLLCCRYLDNFALFPDNFTIMSRSLQQIRNIGIIAHIDAGLYPSRGATVTERTLYYANFTHKVGMVDQGTTTTDFDPEEQERAPYRTLNRL